MLMGFGNMLVMTCWIGPHAYGIFVTAVGLTTFLASLARFGVDTYLIRCEAPPERREYNVAFTLVMMNSIGLLMVGVAIIPILKNWYSQSEFIAPYLALLVSLPVTGAAGIPIAKLERELNFGAVAAIELGAQASAFLVAVVAAWRGMGVWAPVLGMWAWQVVGLGGSSRLAKFSAGLAFDGASARKMLAFGLGFSASMRIWQLRTLVNPLLVGKFAGAEGVAFVAFAIRVADALGFVRTAAGRLAIAALAKLQADRRQFQNALQDALRVQVLVLGPLLCAFAVCGPWLVPKIMGERWLASLLVYPFVAAGVLLNSVFNLQASALFVLGRQWPVARAYGAHVLLLAAASWWLLPRLGIVGYGWAELAACAGYVGIQRGLGKVTEISYRKLLPWVAVFLVPMAVEVVNR